MDYPQFIVEEEVFQSEIEKGSLFKSFINSTIAFIIAYFVVQITFQLATVFTASYYQIETDWFYYRVNFLAVTYSPLWNEFSIKAIFSSGPLISLIMGFVYFAIYQSGFNNRAGLFKLLLIWASLHSFNRFFGDFVGGDLAQQFTEKFLGFVYVTNWMHVSKDLDDWLAISCIIILIAIGYFSARYFLSTAYSRFFIFNNRMKFYFKMYNIFLPAVVGTCLIFFIRLPDGDTDEIAEFLSYNINELVTYASIIIMLIPIFNSYNTQLDLAIQIVSDDRKQRIAWGYLIIMLIIVAAYRILLDPNMDFGLHFDAMERGFDIDNYIMKNHRL